MAAWSGIFPEKRLNYNANRVQRLEFTCLRVFFAHQYPPVENGGPFAQRNQKNN
jgi:hypothetical protein